MKRYLLLAVCLAAVSLVACGKESTLPEATGKASVRAINTIPTSPPFSFLIEERVIDEVGYKTASAPARYDDLEYVFNFDVVLPGAPGEDSFVDRVASQALDVQADKDYTFIISGATAAPMITIWEGDERAWGESETAFELRFGHTAASLGEVDAYFLDPAIPPAQGSELGTVAFGEFVPATDLEAGTYVLTLTPAGDDTTILFQFDPVELVAQTQILISVFDGDANDLSPLAARAFNLTGGGAGALVDASAQPTIRLYHASMDFDTADIYFDDPLTTPAIEDHAFRDISGDLEVPAGTLPLTYTTADNMGSILIDTDRPILAGTHSHYYVVENSAGNDVLVDHFPDRRSVETLVKVSFINTAAIGEPVDIYTVPSGTSIDPDPPAVAVPLLVGVPVGLDPIDLSLVPGNFDIWVTRLGDTAEPLAGPVPLDVALGDVVEVIIYETADPNAVDVVFVPVP